MELTAGYIDSLSPNAGAISNGKDLVRKGSFRSLMITSDKTLLFGECAGSGGKVYQCSMDFIDKLSPIPRCSCPSRQIPCKHVIGLMYAYAGGKQFAESDLPEDIAQKREKAALRSENKEKKLLEKNPDAPGSRQSDKSKITAAIKRLDVQSDGVGIAEKLLENIVRTGLAGIDARARDALQAQVTELGNYHIKGIQAAFNELLLNMREQDSAYAGSIARILFIRALLSRAREHLSAKKQDAAGGIFKRDTSGEIEEQIGHVWKLDELHAHGRCTENARIVQLSFNVLDNPARKEFTDQSYYICTGTGKIYVTKNFRPYKSVKYISRDDTLFGAISAPELYIYPGGLNPRVRFDKHTVSEPCANDYALIKSFACRDYAGMSKTVKNQIKTPLADKTPAALLMISRVSRVVSEAGDIYALVEDGSGAGQLLCGHTAQLLLLFDFGLLSGQAVLAAYENDRDNGILAARPLSIVTDDRIIRLEY